MRLFRRRNLVRNVGALVVLVGLCFIFFRSNSGHLALNLDRSFNSLKFKSLNWRPKECLSLAKRIQISANFTLNNILDRMKLSFGYTQLKATLDKQNFPIAEKSTKYKSSIDNEILHIVVIPHSHNDPGWLKTYDKYFEEDTTHILSLAVEKLYQYPDMTFIWVESCFLHTWWQNQTESTRQKFRDLVKSGRIEMVSGSFVAPDEASPHYFSLVDQLVEGHYWVKHNLGIVPETSLSFDQFGYSVSIPYLMKQAGLKNILIKRTHRGVKQLLGENQWMTFNWRQFFDPKGKDDVLAQVDTYEWMSISDSCGPDRAICRGIDFSVMPDLPKPGSPEANRPIRIDHMSSVKAKNLDDFVQQLVRQFRLKNANYQQKVMLLPHGGDFHYSKPENWDRQYRNLKLFMDYINEREDQFKVNIKFGTFKDYFEELHRQQSVHKLDFPVISGDFFTYTESNDYWTGYYTTRQFDKRLGREVQESLRAAELFAAISFSKAKSVPIPETRRKTVLANLVLARQNLGIFQHHDAITGTARAHVVEDYEDRLSRSFTATQDVLTSAIDHLLQEDKDATRYESVLSVLRRKGYNELTERVPVSATISGSKVILVNPLIHSRQDVISLTVGSLDVVLLDHKGFQVDFDAVHQSKDTAEILFKVDFPPVSILVYTLQEKSKDFKHTPFFTPEEPVICENSQINVTFSHETGSPTQICYKSENFCSKFIIDWVYYRGSGGAYSMISNGRTTPAYTSTPKILALKNRHVCRVEVDYGYFNYRISLDLTASVTGRSLRISTYSDLSKESGFNGDLSMRIATNINNNQTFYTDSNGIQLMGRRFRQSIPFDGNVYPISCAAAMEDNSVRLIVHSAQPHGVVSPANGVLDLMIDRVARRPEMGMPEGVMDNKPTKTILFLEFQTNAEFEKLDTPETALLSINSVYLNDIVQHPVYKFYSIDDMKISKTEHSFLQHDLSCDVMLANIKNLASDDLVSDGVSLTFHRRGVSCPKNLTSQVCHISEAIAFNPGAFIHGSSSQSVHHMSLSHLMTQKELLNNEEIVLKPMDFKTFHVQY